MKILIVSDYFLPFNPGGGEWSVYYLAKAFNEKGLNSVVLTPNYGTVNKEVLDGINIERFMIPLRLKNQRSVVTPILQNNPIFFLWSLVQIVRVVIFQKIDIIHIHGKYLIPGGVIAGKILRKPVLVTVRDKQLLCNFGKCLFEENRYKACNFAEYLLKDLPWFYENYMPNKNLVSFLYILIASIWNRIAKNIMAGFAKMSDQVIAISISQKKYLEVNGFKNVKVIYNTMVFSKNIPKSRSKKNILYAGKLSLGKGIFELLNAIPQVSKNGKNKFILAGGIENPDLIKEAIKKNRIKEQIQILGNVKHAKLQKMMEQAKIVVMPSIFPEAFGRVALEALVAGTPVVVSNTGGLPEIVTQNETGIICSPRSTELARSINKILTRYDYFLKNVIEARKDLIKKFEEGPINQHLRLYNKIFLLNSTNKSVK